MNLNTVPTKGNLMSAKSSLALARQGYELMDKKRNILVREIMDLNDQAKAIQSEIDETFKSAYIALEKANIELGIKNVETFAFNVTPENDIRIKTRSIMGTEIPLVKYKEEKRNPVYSFFGTTESLDQAKASFEKVKDLTIKLSMIENSAYRLAYNIKKTQKRANALKNITIPTTRLPPPTNCPNVSTTLPAYPCNKIFLVELTLSDILNSVVIKSNVGNIDIFNASFEKSELKRITSAIPILNKIKISSNNVGIGTIKNTTGTKIYKPRNISCLFIHTSIY